MKIRAKLIAAVCGALLLEGVVSFLAVYLGLSKFITPGALIAYSIVVILSIIAGATIATVFSFRFVKRMEVVKEQLTAMADHDLTYQIPEKTLKVKDELGDIARTSAKTAESLREMVETLNAMLSGMDKNIVETSERVDNLSEKLEGMSATTEQVSTGLMETAAAMHELDVSTDEVEVVMKGVAKQAQEGAEEAEKINTRALELQENAKESRNNANRILKGNKERMEEAIRQAIERADIVILTGGLGPTKDDLTKEVTAKVFGRKLYMDEHSRARIRDYFEKIKSKKVTENNWKQALVPEGAIVIDNLNGTAPGLILEDKERGKAAILIPGPPNEMKPMFEHDIAPYLNKKQPEGIYSHMVKVCGIGESRAETMVADLMDAQTNPTLAPYAKTGEVHFRVTARACSEEAAEQLMEPMIEEMKKRFGDAVYTTEENVTLEESVIRLLEEKKMTVTTAESCTGGKLSGRLLNVSGASGVYNEGYITYANASKEKILGVKHETLETYGAVSEQTAAEMALGAAKAAGADAALSVTGIAGPGGGTAEKPVGLVYIGCAVKGEVTVREYRFTGNREKNRDYAVARAITLLREELLKRA